MRYMWKFFLLLMLVVTSCSEKQIDGNVINVAEAMSRLSEGQSVQNLFSSISYIPLETNEQAIIGKYSECIIMDSAILVSSVHQNLKLFDRTNGKYIRDIGHVGTDPEGYAKDSWGKVSFWADAVRRTVYLLGWNNDFLLHLLPKADGPFSFFHWIFIHPSSHTEEEFNEILTHEQTHARQWHSIDVIISELVCIFCWCNPFAWLMKREIRTNLEYMADARVLENGYDSKTYQYHLLGLSHQKAAATIYNSFNVLPLKKRIKMMNKKRTKGIGRTKYLMFLPLAALLMIVSNIEAVARTTKKIAAEVIEAVDAKTGQAVPEVQAPQVAPLPEQDTKTVTYKGKVVDKDTLDNPIFEVVEHMPEFPDGGMSALMEYLSKNIKYPEAAMKKGTQGRATVQFVVEKDGSITNVKILRGIDPELNKEAVRVISAMPKWKPGTQKGEAVRVKYTVPVMFRLTENNTQVKYAPIESKIDEMVVVGYAPEEATYPEEVTVFEVVEKMPEYPGGMSAMMEFIGKNIKYPVAAQKAKIQGRVVIQFIVDKEGNIICPRVIRGADPLLDAEAIRLTTIMPKWKPGMQRGQAVNVKYTVPIMFRLQEPEKSPAVQNATVTPTK